MDETPNELICAERGRAGLVRLNRPKAVNALTPRDDQGLEAFTHACARNPHIYGIVMEAEGKGFCAGGDIRVIRDWSQNSPKEADRYYIEEYQHNWTLQCFRKPHVALINGSIQRGIPEYLNSYRTSGESLPPKVKCA